MKILRNLFKCLATILSLPAFLLLISCKKNSSDVEEAAKTKSQTASPGLTAASTTYQLIWSDEFDGNSVNTADWNFETGGGGWGNNEQEYYQSANATVANGNLVITAKKQRVKS